MSYSCDESYDVYSLTYPCARKEHRCDACGATIRPGDWYALTRTVFDGTAESVKRCGRCEATHAHLRELCAGHDLWPDERLSCGLDYAAEWEEEPPPEVAALPFLSASEASDLMRGARGKWERERAERRAQQEEADARRRLGLFFGALGQLCGMGRMERLSWGAWP